MPRLTDAIYEITESQCFNFLNTFVKEVIRPTNGFYFERKANVRFHLPYDSVAGQEKLFQSYVKRRGPGKITAHNPHRDSWLRHPSNVINVWIAMGSIKSGNSLIIFPEAYKRNIRKSGVYISKTESPGSGVTFAMSPGDVLLFHGDHLHSSEINSTDCTRHVISFRLTFEKPRYRYQHFYRYAHSALAGGLLDNFADIPQNIAWSYVRHHTMNRAIHRAKRVAKLLGFIESRDEYKSHLSMRELDSNAGNVEEETPRIHIEDIGVGQIKAISKSICIARIENDKIGAFGRYCPHKGADLSLGTLRNGKIMCPWHNLPLDPETGANPCQSLKKLKTYSCKISNDLVHVF